MAIRGRYQAPSVRHRARAGGIVIGGVEIISPRVKIHADSIFAGTLNADLIKAGTIQAGLIKKGTLDSVRIPNLNASKITAGTINADRVSVSGTITTKNLVVGALGKVKIQGALNNISVWDASNNLRIELGSLS